MYFNVKNKYNNKQDAPFKVFQQQNHKERKKKKKKEIKRRGVA